MMSYLAKLTRWSYPSAPAPDSTSEPMVWAIQHCPFQQFLEFPKHVCIFPRKLDKPRPHWTPQNSCWLLLRDLPEPSKDELSLWTIYPERRAVYPYMSFDYITHGVAFPPVRPRLTDPNEQGIETLKRLLLPAAAALYERFRLRDEAVKIRSARAGAGGDDGQQALGQPVEAAGGSSLAYYVVLYSKVEYQVWMLVPKSCTPEHLLDGGISPVAGGGGSGLSTATSASARTRHKQKPALPAHANLSHNGSFRW